MTRLAPLSPVILLLALAVGWTTAVASPSGVSAEAIEGVLKARDGDGLRGTIECRSFAAPSKGTAVPTESDGTFRITGLVPGHYELRGSAKELGWGVTEMVVAAGTKAVDIELLRSLEVRGKVRARLAEKALGEDLAVTVVGQPIREAAAATAAPVNPDDGTFTLDDLAETESLIYATTQNGWISWPFLTKDQPPGALQPSLTLHEGGQMVLEGRGDSMWTRFELRGVRSWMTRFTLGPKETRRVTVPAGEIEVMAAACRRKPSDIPGVDLSSSGLVRVSRGTTADLTRADAMSWK